MATLQEFQCILRIAPRIGSSMGWNISVPFHYKCTQSHATVQVIYTIQHDGGTGVRFSDGSTHIIHPLILPGTDSIINDQILFLQPNTVKPGSLQIHYEAYLPTDPGNRHSGDFNVQVVTSTQINSVS